MAAKGAKVKRKEGIGKRKEDRGKTEDGKGQRSLYPFQPKAILGNWWL